MSDWSTMQPQQPSPPTQPGWGQPTLTPEQLRDKAILEWLESVKTLAAAKQDEVSRRNAIVAMCFPNPTEGTNNLVLGNGYTLKCVVKYNYTMDKDNAKVEAALEAIERLGDEGKFLADRIVRWTPELSVTEYRELGTKYKAEIDKVLTIKPGQSSLELAEPKAKK